MKVRAAIPLASMARTIVASLACLGSTATTVRAETCALPWQNTGNTVTELGSQGSSMLLVAAAVTPVLAAPTGFDHEARRFAQGPLGGRYDLEPVTVVVPWLVPPAALLAHLEAQASGACTLQRTSAAVLQGTLLTAAAVVALKGVTGRAWPNGDGDPTAPDRLDHPEWSRSFDPFSGRLSSAWPSGHAAIMVAAAAAIDGTGEAPSAAWTLYGASALVGAGMIVGDHHYVSDVASGALIGFVIGHAAGRAFAFTAGGSDDASPGEHTRAGPRWHVTPLLGDGLGGAAIAGTL